MAQVKNFLSYQYDEMAAIAFIILAGVFKQIKNTSLRNGPTPAALAPRWTVKIGERRAGNLIMIEENEKF